MKTKSNAFKKLTDWTAVFALNILLLGAFAMPAGSQIVSPQITGAQVVSNKFALTWAGNSFSYEIQMATNMPTTNWTSILATFRTNALVSMPVNAAFFRVIDPDTNLTLLVITATNLSSGDTNTWYKLPQTNGDLAFYDSTSGSSFPRLIPSDQLKKVDVAFDGLGGFTFVTTNGEPTQYHGLVNTLRSSGTNTVTYSGMVTDNTNVTVYTAVAADPILDGLIGLLNFFICSIPIALENLGCQASVPSKGIACFFSGQGSAVGGVTGTNLITFDGTNIIWQCNVTCKVCCQNGNNPPTSCN